MLFRRQITLGYLLALGLVAILTFVFRGSIFGHRATGVADSLAQIPGMYPRLSALPTTGSVRYAIARHPHGTTHFDITGYTTRAGIDRLCSVLKLEVSSGWTTEVADPMVDDAKKVGIVDSRSRGFADSDVLFDGRLPDGGHLHGVFRNEDGWFLISGWHNQRLPQ